MFWRGLTIGQNDMDSAQHKVSFNLLLSRTRPGCVVTFRDSVGTLKEEKPYVHRFPYCEHMCYAQNRGMSVWP